MRKLDLTGKVFGRLTVVREVVERDSSESVKWCVKIKRGNERRQVGRFDTEQDAALAYNEAAKELFGEYANLNKIETN